MLGFIRSWSDWIESGLRRRFNYVQNKLTSALYILTVFIVILWLSVFMYGSFYYTYVPTLSRVRPVHLEFSVGDDGVGMCSFPTANMSLLNEGEDEVFIRGQIYSIVLEIELPETPQNQNLGMFMVKLDFYNHVGRTVSSSSRSAMLHFKSMLLRIMDTFVFSPFLLFGWKEQRQTLFVELFTKYHDDSYNPAIGAVIQVMSKKIDIYSTKLHIQAHFTGYRYILFHWPVFSAIFGISFNFILLTFICGLSWYQFGSKKSSQLEKEKNIKHQRYKVERDMENSQGQVFGAVVPQNVGSQDSDNDDQTDETELLSTYRTDASIPECDTALRQRKNR